MDWNNFATEGCVEALERNFEEIGGPGEIVETYQSKFGKKYHHGKRVEGHQQECHYIDAYYHQELLELISEVYQVERRKKFG